MEGTVQPSTPRWQLRFENLRRTLARMDAAVAQESLSELERCGLIKLFELAFELSWNLLKDVLREEGIDVKLPREIIREAFAIGLLTEQETEVMLQALLSRIRLVNLYSEDLSREGEQLVKGTFLPTLRSLEIRIAERLP